MGKAGTNGAFLWLVKCRLIMFSEFAIYDILRMLLFGTFGLFFGLSFFGGVALWRFMKQSRIPGPYHWDQNDSVPLDGKRTPTAGR